jgi:hypothetical protein
VLVVILVILLVFGVTLMAVSSRFNAAVLQHEQQQAYYTAYSSTSTVSEWIVSGSAAGAGNRSDVEAFLATVPGPETPDGIEYPLGTASGGTLPSEMGECTVTLRYLDVGRTELEISSTATFASVQRVVSLTMVGKPDIPGYEEAQVSTFDPTTTNSIQQQRVQELNALEVDPYPVVLGSYYDNTLTPSYIDTDDVDIGLVASISGDSAREAKWDTYSLHPNYFTSANAVTTYSMGASNTVTDGTQQENVRTFVAPSQTTDSGAPLARMTFNPLRIMYSSYNGDPNKAGNQYNTRLTSLAISHTAGKNVYLRLGGEKTGTADRTLQRYSALMAFDFVDQQTGANMKANPYVNYYPNNLVMPVELSPATGPYTTATPQYDGYPANSLVQHGWYPQTWASCAIFTQRKAESQINKGIATNLIFHPYFNSYVVSRSATDGGAENSYFDYWGLGSYVSNPNYGQSSGDAFRAFTSSLGSSAGANKRGMPTVPVYYGENFDLYLHDNVGTTDAERLSPTYRGNMAWLQQGVNILNDYTYDRAGNIKGTTGSIYTTRGLTIGGTYTRTASGMTAEYVSVGAYYEKFIDGVNPTAQIVEYFAQLRYGTIIYNTDIALVTTLNTTETPRNSAFRPALNYCDVTYPPAADTPENMSWRKLQSYYLPQTKIIGGRVYVGAGQTLTIYGGTQLYTNPTGKWADRKLPENATGEYSIYVAPKSITVAKGATLIILPSENVNVNTTIYVDGGTLFIQPGAKIKGNIYCYNGGTVDIKGSFSLDAPDAPAGTDAEELVAFNAQSGIHILGTPVVGDLHTTNGKLIVPLITPTVSGTSNRIHLHGNFVNLVTVGSASGKLSDLSKATSYLCREDTDTNSALPGYDANGRCLHPVFTSAPQPGGWILGPYRE